jgi:hypothetical protein
MVETLRWLTTVGVAFSMSAGQVYKLGTKGLIAW